MGMKILNLTQGSQDWLKWRETGIGASDACHLLGKARWNSPTTLRRIKTGQEKVEMNAAMRRGQELEPVARILFQDLTGMRVAPVCCYHSERPWQKASLDGITDDHKTVVEIKCPTSEKPHLTALAGSPPDYYYPQLQHQLAVTEADRVCYVSYHPEFEAEERIVIIDVLPDPEYIQKLIEVERAFWESLRR